MKDILKHASDFMRSIRNKRYERMDNGGLYMADQKIQFVGVGGIRNITHNEAWDDNLNLVTIQGIVHILNTGVTASTFYFAPYAANVAPVNTLTASNFASSQTEFTNYTEATRQLCDYNTATTATISNVAAPVSITIDAGPQTSIYGFGIMSTSAKSSTAGVCLAVAPLGAGRTGLQTGDEYGLRHTLTGSST